MTPAEIAALHFPAHPHLRAACEAAITEAIAADREADDRLQDPRLFLPVDVVREQYTKYETDATEKDVMIAGLQNEVADGVARLAAVAAGLSHEPASGKSLETWARDLYHDRSTLARWKHEALTVQSWWREIDDFVRQHPETKLGVSVAARALELLRERDEVVRTLVDCEEEVSKVYCELTNNRFSKMNTRAEFILGAVEEANKEQVALIEHCRAYIAAQSILCAESCHQTDRVSETSGEFIEGVCNIVGYCKDTDADPSL